MYWYLVVELHDQEHNGGHYLFSRKIELFVKREQEVVAAALAYITCILYNILVILHYYYIYERCTYSIYNNITRYSQL